MLALLLFLVLLPPSLGSLTPLKYTPLPYGLITPQSWLLRELRLQGDGLSGKYFPEYWEPVTNSEWFGGNSTYEDYAEILPYVIQGFVPQAILLNDTEQLAISQKWIDSILSTATSDGWFGPTKNQPTGMLYWPRWPIVLTFLAWHEYGMVVNGTADKRLLDVSLAWIHSAYHNLTTTAPLGHSWSGTRWQDFVLTIQALMDCPATPSSEMLFLEEALAEVYKQGSGVIDWTHDWYVEGKFPTTGVPHWDIIPHGVNNAMAIKSGAVSWRAGLNFDGFASSYERMLLLDMYHGAPAGHFQADECLAGNMPSRGAETCLVVEEMFSLSVIHEVQGDAFFKDREERIAYNSLPGALTKDMWARVYLQQANELLAAPTNPHVWVSDGPDSTVFSLADNFACCTANFNQGWPRHIQHMIHVSESDKGIAISSFGPLTARIPSLGAHGGDLWLNMSGDYPFEDEVTVTIDGLPEGAVDMPVYVRIPSWAVDATISINNGRPMPVGQHNGTMLLLSWPDGTQGPLVSVHIATNPRIRVEHYYNNSIAVYRGALLYALALGEDMKVVKTYEGGARDYNITLDAKSVPWNMALVVDQSNMTAHMRFSRSGPVPEVPFAAGASPLSITATARPLIDWPIVENAAGPPPRSPVECTTTTPTHARAAGVSEKRQCGDAVEVKLVPFGSTHLRMTELPFVYS